MIATAGSADKLGVCKQYGADELVDYRSDDWQKKVLAVTGGKGVGEAAILSNKQTRWCAELLVAY